MNLAQAFKKRNKLQNEITELRNMYTSSVLVREEGEEEQTDRLNGMTCKQLLDEISFKENNLEALITMIDEANKNIKPTLSKIQHLKSMKKFRENLLNLLRSNAGEKRYYAENDKTIKYFLNLNPKEVYKSIKRIEEEIEMLEDKVSNYNAITLINADKSVEK